MCCRSSAIARFCSTTATSSPMARRKKSFASIRLRSRRRGGARSSRNEDALVKPIHLFVPSFRVDECLAEVRECLEKGWTGLGYKTVEFERQWIAHTGLPHAHFVNSATSGLHL